MNRTAKQVKSKNEVTFRDQFVAMLLMAGKTCETWAASNHFHPSLVSLAINGRQSNRPVIRRIRDAAERFVKGEL